MDTVLWKWESLTEQQRRRALLAVGTMGLSMGGALVLVAPGLAMMSGGCVFLGMVALIEGAVRFGITDLPPNRDAVLGEIAKRIEAGERWVLLACSAAGVDELLRWRDGRIAGLLKAKADRGMVVEILRGREASPSSPISRLPNYQVYFRRWDLPFHGVLVDGRVLIQEAQHPNVAAMSWQDARCMTRPGFAADRFELSFDRQKRIAHAA